MPEEEKKRTIIISGVRPTNVLYSVLSERFEVAVYDVESAQQLAGSIGSHVVCPLAGAQSVLLEQARNDAGWQIGHIASQVPEMVFSSNGIEARPRWLPGLALGQLLDVTTNLRVLDAFAEHYDVAGVIVHEDITPRYKALALWAKARGLPSVHIPHGNCFNQTRPDVHDESVSDWILATSPYMRDWYAARGFPKNRIKITGYPNWDTWHRPQVERGHARKILHLSDEEKPIVCLCTGWPQRTNIVDDHDAIEIGVFSVLEIARKRDWRVIWKLHPGDAPGQEEHCTTAAARMGVRALVTRDHLPLAMRAADVIVGIGPSNVLVEAGLCDRPPAIFDIRGYGFEGVPPWHFTADDVGDVLEWIASDEGQSEWKRQNAHFVRRYAYKNDGRATERAVRHITKVASCGIVL